MNLENKFDEVEDEGRNKKQERRERKMREEEGK